MVAAADSGSGPRVVGGFVPEKFHGPPAVRWEGNLLSWEFINGLFALIFALEFLYSSKGTILSEMADNSSINCSLVFFVTGEHVGQFRFL